jgi:L-asparagine permease
MTIQAPIQATAAPPTRGGEIPPPATLRGDAANPAAYAEPGDVGYRHTLGNLQIQMIAIGGAVGVGLFLGLGARLNAAGPGLLLSYVAVSVVVYLMMRALGEMVVYRPTTARSCPTRASSSATASPTSRGGST